MDKSSKRPIDGVRLAVFNNRLEGIARKMANTLLRTGRSGVLNIARDFSCCIVTRDDELVATAESLPIHVLAGPDLMAKSMKEFHPNFKRGDAYLHNSPYHGCSHPADHTILVPVIDGAGNHHFTVVAKAHQADCGNSQPTTYFGAARDVYEEGALIFPCTKVQEDYRNIEDVIRLCRMRIRVPEQWWGDYLAMVGAARIGERELLALGEETGWDNLHEFTRQWFDYSESRMVNAIRKIPSGTGKWTTTHDPVPGSPPDGIPINVEITVDSENARIAVDLRNNIDALPCGLNLSEACARTASMVGIFNSIDSTVPKNAGAFRRLDIHLREGAVCGIPKHPTSCSVSTTNIADRVANGVQASLAELCEGIGLAECGPIVPATTGVVSGIDPKTGEAYINQLILAMTGGAGSPRADAWTMMGHVGNAGLCYQDSIELDELRHPLFILERRFLADTEGAGRYKGAPSMRVEFGPVRGSMQIAFVSDGTINAAKGVRGGLGGGPARQAIRQIDGTMKAVDLCAVATVLEGERIVAQCSGGGGYGPPSERGIAEVATDLREGWLTPERAQEVYRVVVAQDGSVDRKASEALRAAA